MELFKRSANDAYDNTAVLRLDLLSKYEEQSCLQEILSLILPHIRDLFQCTQVITKCVQEAEKRRAVLLDMGFSPSKEPLVGWDGTLYQNYYLPESYKKSNIKNENVYTGTKVLRPARFCSTPFIPDSALSIRMGCRNDAFCTSCKLNAFLWHQQRVLPPRNTVKVST